MIPSRLRLKCGIAAVGAVLIVAGGGCSGDSAAPRQPGVSVNDLLAPVEFVAQNWPTEGWELYATVALRQRFARTDEAMRRTWWVANSGGGLEQVILKFDSPADAQRNFDRDDPRSYDEDFPLRVDESESYRSMSAEESRLYCLGQEGSSEACPVWAYWARYGQYIMRLDHIAGLQTTDADIFTLQPGIGLDHFLGYVRAFDDYVTETLTPTTPTPS